MEMTLPHHVGDVQVYDRIMGVFIADQKCSGVNQRCPPGFAPLRLVNDDDPGILRIRGGGKGNSVHYGGEKKYTRSLSNVVISTKCYRHVCFCGSTIIVDVLCPT